MSGKVKLLPSVIVVLERCGETITAICKSHSMCFNKRAFERCYFQQQNCIVTLSVPMYKNITWLQHPFMNLSRYIPIIFLLHTFKYLLPSLFLHMKTLINTHCTCNQLNILFLWFNFNHTSAFTYPLLFIKFCFPNNYRQVIMDHNLFRENNKYAHMIKCILLEYFAYAFITFSRLKWLCKISYRIL